ncbi:MAG: TIGR03808 family TAT-translocated repetitive protein [Methylocystis sp.]
MNHARTRIFAHPTRRGFLGLAAGCLATPFSAKARDQTGDLAEQLRSGAARNIGGALRLPPGVIAIRSLELPPGARLIGAPSGTTLKLIGPGPLLHAAGSGGVTLESIIFDGGDNMVEAKRGLLDFEDAAGLSIRGCGIKNSSGHGVNLTRCGGVFAQNRIEHVQGAGFHSLDGLGFDIDGNHISDCGDNGVMVWTSQAGRYEGSRIRNNIIEDIHNISGGDGPYGNGVSIWGSGSVRVENNRIYRCAYTAVRNNAGHDILVIGNDCKGFGEKAMYAEFGAKRATFRDNKIFDAGGGIALANAEGGTDIGVVTGNTVANLRESHPDSEFGPSMFWMTGILAERNCEIAGNTIIGPAWIGVMLGGYRENLRAEGNAISGADYGIAFATGPRVGDGVIASNKIAGSRKAAIVAMAGPRVLEGDLLAPGARSFPRLRVEGNVAG